MYLSNNYLFRFCVLLFSFSLIGFTPSFSQSSKPVFDIENEVALINKDFLNAIPNIKVKPCSFSLALPLETLLKEALAYDRQGNWQCCQSILRLAGQKVNTYSLLQQCHYHLAMANYLTLHQCYDSAKWYAMMVNKKAGESNWKNEKVLALLVLANGGLRQRNISAAYVWADSALQIARKIGDEILEGKALLQLALCARRNFTAIANRSVSYFLMAREKALATQDSLALGAIDLYLGTDDFEVNKWEEGNAYFKEGMALSQSNADYSQLYLAHIALGYTFQLRSHPKEAVVLFGKALHLALSQKAPYDVQHCYHDLSRCYQALHQYDSALMYANLAATVPGVDSFWANVWDTKAGIYEDIGNYKLAATMYKKSVDWYREDFLYRNQDQLSAYEATLNTKEKELLVTQEKKRALQLEWMMGGIGGLFLISVGAFSVQRKARRKLFLQNNLIQHQRAALERSLSEKEVLLKEIHHRVKNNLSVISSLLELQSTGLQDETAKAALAVGQNRVSSIALIHKQLYQNENLAAIELNGFLKDLLGQVSSVFKKPGTKIKTHLAVPETLLNIDTALPLGLIMNELITNSYKYAFDEAKEGLIEIDLQQQKTGEYLLTYADNGPGICEEINVKNTTSLGLRLIHRLSNQLGGHAIYHYSNGCSFNIYFKDSNTRNKEG